MPPSQTVFRRYVALGAAAVPLYLLLPTVGQDLALLASNLVSLTAVLWAVRRRGLRPLSGWLLYAAFPACTAVGNAVYLVNQDLRHVAPFPSPGDAAFLGGYLLLAAGLLRLRSRTAEEFARDSAETGESSLHFTARQSVHADPLERASA
jgi:hypothetical protein